MSDRAAPAGKFQVVWVDPFDESYGVCLDDTRTGPIYFDTGIEAITFARKFSGKMLLRHVYDDKGKCIFRAGSN